jgi:hypothetical protein
MIGDIMEYETATEQLQRLQRSAWEIWQRDNRVRMMIQSAVAIAQNDFGPIDPDEANRAANDIATRACMLIAAQILDGDAELKALREQNAKLQELAMNGLSLTAMPMLLLKDHPPSRN